MKRWLVMFGAAATLVIPTAALAFGAAAGDMVTVPKGQTHAGTYYAVGSTVAIDGTIDGDLVCAGSNVTVTGAVHGDVLCAGQTVTISGPVDGSVRAAGQTVTLSGSVGRNVTVAGQTVTLESGAKVAGDAGWLAQTAQINGTVAKDLYGAMQSLGINGTVGPTAVRVQSLVLGQTAGVHGDLSYTSQQQLRPDNAKVTGTVHFSQQAPAHSHRSGLGAMLAGRLYWTLAMLLAGVALVGFFPRAMQRVSHTLLSRPGASLGWGTLATLLGPMVMIALALTVVGIPLAGVVLVAWGLALLFSPVFAGLAVGLWVLHRLDWQRSSLWWGLGTGVVLVMALETLPAVGALATLVASFWAMGGLLLTVHQVRGAAPTSDQARS